MKDEKIHTNKYNPYFQGTYVELMDILDQRERRVTLQEDLLHQYRKPLLCFSMNIAGPIKNNPLIRAGFEAGCSDLRATLLREKTPLLHQEYLHEVTGNEAYIVVDTSPMHLKRLVCELEDADALGRLYDMDVLYLQDGISRKIERRELNLPERSCLICGSPGRDCASRRLHTVEELQTKTCQILLEAVTARYADQAAEYATRSLLYEVSTTPKPGLVDRINNGSHKDMDYYTFLNSTAALFPYFRQCAMAGITGVLDDKSPQDTFRSLRPLGKQAENRMLMATHGVNTHKGAIFTLGLLSASAGRVYLNGLSETESLVQNAQATNATSGAAPLVQNCRATNATSETETPVHSHRILQEVAAMTKGLVEQDLTCTSSAEGNGAPAAGTFCAYPTFGQHLYAEHGVSGIRGEIEAGLPAVANYGLPLLEQLLAEGASPDLAGSLVLLSLIAHSTDTNLIHRGSLVRQQEVSQEAEALLHEALGNWPQQPERIPESLSQLDQAYIRENLSPGGSADLLAVCWMLHFLCG